MKGFLWVLYFAFHPRKYTRKMNEMAKEFKALGMGLRVLQMRLGMALAWALSLMVWIGGTTLVLFYVNSCTHVIPETDLDVDILCSGVLETGMKVMGWAFLAGLVVVVTWVIAGTSKYGRDWEDDCNVVL